MNPEDTRTIEPDGEPRAKDGEHGNGGSSLSVELKVNRAASKDVGRGIIRLDPSDMERIDCQIGDIVALSGGRLTVARVLPAYTYDRGKSYAFIDGLLRENAAVAIGETITVRKCRALPAIEVTLAAITPRLSGYSCQQIGQSLEGLPVLAGDRIRANYVGASGADFNVLAVSPASAVFFHPDRKSVV